MLAKRIEMLLCTGSRTLSLNQQLLLVLDALYISHCSLYPNILSFLSGCVTILLRKMKIAANWMLLIRCTGVTMLEFSLLPSTVRELVDKFQAFITVGIMRCMSPLK